jgi:hypothetical protein
LVLLVLDLDEVGETQDAPHLVANLGRGLGVFGGLVPDRYNVFGVAYAAHGAADLVSHVELLSDDGWGGKRGFEGGWE